MIRNLIEVLYTLYYHRLFLGIENRNDFETAILSDDVEAKRFGSKLEKRFGRKMVDYLDYPRFSGQIKRYLDVFGKDKVHVIVFDDFKDDNLKVYREVSNFLGVDESFCPDFNVVNDNKMVRNRLIFKIIKTCPWKEIAKKYRPMVKIKRGIINRFNYEYFQRPDMDIKLKKRLQIEFTDEVKHLSELLGRDLTNWVRG